MVGGGDNFCEENFCVREPRYGTAQTDIYTAYTVYIFLPFPLKFKLKVNLDRQIRNAAVD